MAQESNIIEITGTGSLFHIKDKQKAGEGLAKAIIANGGTQKDVDNAAAYGLQISIPKDRDNPEFRKLVTAAKTAGVHANPESMRLNDGDLIKRNDGTPVAPGQWLIDVRSKFDVEVVDSTGQPYELNDEPGNGTKVTVAINVKGGTSGKVNYFLAGVVIEEWVDRPDTHYVFNRFRKVEQTRFDEPDDGGVNAF